MPMRSALPRFSWILALGLALLPKGASAAKSCGQQFLVCIDRAAQMRTTNERSVAGINCEIDFVVCSLRSIRF